MKGYPILPVISSLVIVLLAVGMFQIRIDSPELAAREFSRALTYGDHAKLDERTCADLKAQPEITNIPRSAFSTLGESLDNPELNIGNFELSFTTTDVLTETAAVRVSGPGASNAGASPTSTRVKEVWRMQREGGEWKFCGEALIPQSGLAGLLLQPSEVNFPMLDSEDTLADVLSAYPQTYTGFRQAGAKGAVLKEYTLDGKWIDSFGFWFPSYGDAAKGMGEFTNFLRFITRTNQQTVAAADLGDEGASFTVVSPPDYELYAYIWRAGNVVLALGIRAKPGQLKLSDARGWADKMQSHVR